MVGRGQWIIRVEYQSRTNTDTECDGRGHREKEGFWLAGGSLVKRGKRVTAVRPNEHNAERALALVGGGFGGLGDYGDEAHEGFENEGGAEDKWEELADKYDQLEKKMKDYLDDQQDVGVREPPVIKAPPKMTKEEWDKHQVTHTPYSPSCRHCVADRAVRYRHPRKRKHKHLVPDVDGSHEGPVKVSMDYMYLSERTKDEKDNNNNPPQLVVVDHRFGRVWAHRVPNKGVWGKAEWVPKRIIQDLINNGMQNIRIQIKTDKEPAMINIQTAMQELHPDRIIPSNSPVGESESNGRVENAIRRVQEKIRALRHHVEANIKCQTFEGAFVMAWMVRWSAELISKYVVGDDGRTPYERLRKEDCVTPFVPFGETFMYLPFKIVRRNKGMPAKRTGVWLGISERIEEVLIGTKRGVVKCRTVERLEGSERWNRNNVLEMVGTPWEPILGKEDHHIPVDIADNGDFMGSESENEDEQPIQVDEENDNQEYKGNVDKFHVSKKAIKRFGETKGCAACAAIKARGDQPGRIGIHHSNDCRRRILREMAMDPMYRHLVKRYKGPNEGEASNAESSIGNINKGTSTCTTTRPKPNTNEMSPITNKIELIKMCSNVRKAIANAQERIQKTKDELSKRTGECVGNQLNNTMLGMMVRQMQVSEVYSPPKVVEMANKMGLRGGWSLDLTTQDENGRPWGFNNSTMRNKAIRKLSIDQPLVLIGSLMCIEYSAINRLNHCKMSKEEVETRMAYARKHLEFCVKFYEIQWRNGRYFLHEHPAEAGSWAEPMMRKLMSRSGVQRVVGDECQYGLKSKDESGEAPARKRIGFPNECSVYRQAIGEKMSKYTRVPSA